MKDRIKLIRQNAGMTQQEFAKQIGVSRNTIATYETSVRIPIDAIVLSICREFNINETWLRTGEGNMYMEENPDFMLSKWFGEILREESSAELCRYLCCREKQVLSFVHKSFDKLINADQLSLVCFFN